MSREQTQPRRFIAIPFSSGCRSQSSVDVVDTAARRAGKKPQGSELGPSAGGSGGAPGKPAVGKGESLVARLLRGFKNLSQIFAVYDDDDDDEEEEEREMVIGLPTDVKHVAHIGWDGSTNTTTSLRSWNRAAPPAEPGSAAAASTSSASAAQQPQPLQQQAAAGGTPTTLPALSMRQFELAMAAQAAGAGASSAGRRRDSS